MKSGTFHGVIAATTPTGARRTRTGPPIMPVRVSTHWYWVASAAYESSTIVAENTWPMIDHCFGEPFSDEIVSAMSCERAWSASERRPIASPRSTGVMCGQGPSSNALRAAATARSTSAVDAWGTCPMTSSVAGEITSMTSEPAGATHSPPM